MSSDERWGLLDILTIGAAIQIPLLFGPAALWAVGQHYTAVVLTVGTWTVVTMYESPLADRWKREVCRVAAGEGEP